MIAELHHPLAVDGIVHVKSVATRFDQPFVFQVLQVLGDGRLGNAEPGCKFADAERPARFG